ncbi:MAG: hypothetical protein H6868_03750 [Rhodospirillales bacterium]|nr:hypothetical protein [Rhodospirillales bacterium]
MMSIPGFIFRGSLLAALFYPVAAGIHSCSQHSVTPQQPLSNSSVKTFGHEAGDLYKKEFDVVKGTVVCAANALHGVNCFNNKP